MSSRKWTYAENPDESAAERGEGFLAIRHGRVRGCRLVIHGPTRDDVADAVHEAERGMSSRLGRPKPQRSNWTGRTVVEVPVSDGHVVITGPRPNGRD